MAGDLEALRNECEELSRKRFRAGLVTLIVLFIAVLAFTRAFRRIDQAEAQEQLRRMAVLAKAANTDPELSYIFSEKWRDIALEHGLSDTANVMPEPGGRSAEQQALAAAAGQLERLAASWFSVSVPLGGPEFDLDLRYWFAVLPLVLWTAFAYLAVVGAKLRVARRIAAAHVTPQSDVLDRLAFSESSAYARYPDVLANRLYISVVAAILIYFLYSSMPFWKLLLGKDDEPLSGPWWTANVLALITCYVALLVWFTQWRIHRQADAMLGSEGPPIVPMRVLRLLRRTGSRAMAVAKRTPRTVVTLGATAIAISPFTMIATTCHNQPRTGADLLLNRNSAGWFTGGSLPESTLPYLGRGFYAATLLLAAVALMAVLLSLVARVSWTPIARALRPFAATAALFMLIELSFVFLAVVFPIMDAIRIAAVITPLVLWLRTRRRERWREVLRPRIEVCLLPAVLFALLTLGRLAAFGFTGLPVYFFGLVVLALPLLAPQEAEAELPAAVAPAYSSG